LNSKKLVGCEVPEGSGSSTTSSISPLPTSRQRGFRSALSLFSYRPRDSSLSMPDEDDG